MSLEIAAAKSRLHAICSAMESSGGEMASSPSDSDLMTKLDMMMKTMALKEDVNVAQLETVKQLRQEFRSELDPLRKQLNVVEGHTQHALK